MDRMAEVFLNFLQMWKHLAMEGQGKSKEVGDKKDDEEDMSLDQATLHELLLCFHQLYFFLTVELPEHHVVKLSVMLKVICFCFFKGIVKNSVIENVDILMNPERFLLLNGKSR